MRARQAVATTLVVLLTAPYASLASDAGGAVTGIVKSVSGETLANVDIDFVNLVTGASRTLRTDGVGADRRSLEILREDGAIDSLNVAVPPGTAMALLIQLELPPGTDAAAAYDQIASVSSPASADGALVRFDVRCEALSFRRSVRRAGRTRGRLLLGVS